MKNSTVCNLIPPFKIKRDLIRIYHPLGKGLEEKNMKKIFFTGSSCL